MNGEQPSDIFELEDGEDFLAHEIGMAGRSFLPPEGKEVCDLVGYQRFALMLVGNMVHKKQKSWSEILSYVQAVRNELGMTV